MRLRIEVKTPAGQAAGAEAKLRTVILWRLEQPPQTWINEENSIFYWEIEATPKQFDWMTRRVGLVQGIMIGIFENKKAKWAITKFADNPQDVETLREMLTNGTTVKILKEATAQEILDDGTTFWERIKKTFKQRPNT